MSELNEELRVEIKGLMGPRYQEILNYGTTGRAVYAGLSVTW